MPFEPKKLEEYTNAEKVVFFDSCYKYALSDFEAHFNGEGYEDGGLKDYDHYCGEKMTELLGDGVFDALCEREED